MKPTRILIAEDEDLIRAEMQRLVAAHWPDAEVVALAEDGAHALELWHAHQPDVAFLDIQMPGMTGLETARAITETDPRRTQIVFVTAYDQHALAAFEAGAVDYLLKPVQAAKLEATVRKLKLRLDAAQASPASQAISPQLAQVLAQLAPKQKLKWLTASSGANIKLISVDEVIYLQSDNKYTRIVMAQGEAFVRKGLKELLDELDPDVFQQVHRSTAVNLREVAGIQRDGTGRGSLRFKQIKDEVDVSSAFLGQFRPM
jgi:DNA-binding LytR/AlgR family response regulator